MFRRVVSGLGILAILAVAGVWWNWLRILPLFETFPEPLPNTTIVSNAGQFGDAYGSLTSLFTALGFIGLAITVLLQWKQLQAAATQVAAALKQAKHAQDAAAIAQQEAHKEREARQFDLLYRNFTDAITWIETAAGGFHYTGRGMSGMPAVRFLARDILSSTDAHAAKQQAEAVSQAAHVLHSNLQPPHIWPVMQPVFDASHLLAKMLASHPPAIRGQFLPTLIARLGPQLICVVCLHAIQTQKNDSLVAWKINLLGVNFMPTEEDTGLATYRGIIVRAFNGLPE